MTNIENDISALIEAFSKEKNLYSFRDLVETLRQGIYSARIAAMDMLLETGTSINEIAFKLLMPINEVVEDLVDSGRLEPFDGLDGIKYDYNRAIDTDAIDLADYIDISIFDRKLERNSNSDTAKYSLQTGEYDPDGYNREGFNRDGYDFQGFDRDGIHRETGTRYNRYGYDSKGYDREGYDRRGFDKNGIHRETGTEYNRLGFDQSRFHESWNS